jgi:hypothetical protein
MSRNIDHRTATVEGAAAFERGSHDPREGVEIPSAADLAMDAFDRPVVDVDTLDPPPFM